MERYAASSDFRAVSASGAVSDGVSGSFKAVRFAWIDNNGIARAKAVTHKHYEARLREGVGVAVCRQAANLLDKIQPIKGFGAVGEVRLVPDPSTIFSLPHAPGAACALGDLRDIEGRPWAACPRSFLQRMINKAAESGYEVVVAFEPEFSLFRIPIDTDRFQPADDSQCFDLSGFDETHSFAMALITALNESGMDPEIFHPEYSPGQHEFTIAAATALKAADRFAAYRILVKGIAKQFGLYATFAAAPSQTVKGNGCHIHISVWRNGKNIFADAAGRDLSPEGLSFAAGLLLHSPALIAVTCPSVNSYQRLRPDTWAGGQLRLGVDDRAAMVRVPVQSTHAPPDRANIEYRACDGTINPYLALGCVIAAGFDGLERGLSSAPYTNGAHHYLPSDLSAALSALTNDALLLASLGKDLSTTYLSVKGSDVADLSEMAPDDISNLFVRRF